QRTALKLSLVRMPSHLVVERARRWLDTGDELLAEFGCAVLRHHATDEDFERLLLAVRRGLSGEGWPRDQGEIAAAVVALRRLTPRGWLPELEAVFQDTNCSHLRTDAVEAFLVHAPGPFVERLGIECLHDAGGRVREHAARLVPLAHAG